MLCSCVDKYINIKAWTSRLRFKFSDPWEGRAAQGRKTPPPEPEDSLSFTQPSSICCPHVPKWPCNLCPLSPPQSCKATPDPQSGLSTAGHHSEDKSRKNTSMRPGHRLWARDSGTWGLGTASQHHPTEFSVLTEKLHHPVEQLPPT